MKTTLKYNTIETFQQQPAWKKFIETIVDACKGLYDDHLVAEFEEGENITKKRVNPITHEDEYLPISNIKLSESNEDIVPQMDLTDLQPKYPVLNYLEDGISLTSRENLSLRGLLRTLSLYKCRILEINANKTSLPHTYKELRTVQEVESIYGLDEQGGYDDPVQATVEGSSGQNVDGTVGNIEIDDDLENAYEYKLDIYGYNQKEPVLTYVEIKSVKKFYWFKVNDLSTLDPNFRDLIESGNLYNIYVNGESINESQVADILAATLNPAYISNHPEALVNFYFADDNGNSGVRLIDLWREIYTKEDECLTVWTLLKACYIKIDYQRKWIFGEPSHSYIVIDKASADMYDFNSSGSLDPLIVSLQEKDNTIKMRLEKTSTTIGTRPVGEQTTLDTKSYYLYGDDENNSFVLMNDTSELKSPLIRKNQVFADECTLKVQPLFLYKPYTVIQDPQGSPKEQGWYEFNGEDYVLSTDNSVVPGKTYYLQHKKVSTCANIKSATGGLNKYTYELDAYDSDDINADKESVDNIDYNNLAAQDSVYGRYYYKWEQYEDTGAYIQDVYTSLKFDELTDADYAAHANQNYFFNGYNDIFPIDSDDYTNNEEKTVDRYKYINTHKLEYFELMYFNHFIKVSPIDGVTDGNTIKTTKLYCDNLELVQFAYIMPYIVSYERKGTYEPNNAGIFDDVDCSIFSKILCYNKHTHLITVDREVYFNNDADNSKYVVVAYGTLSPFNKIQSMLVVAPDSIKNTVAGLLEDYSTDKCQLKLMSKTEYQEYQESLQP